jgi:hypothetical protein
VLIGDDKDNIRSAVCLGRSGLCRCRGRQHRTQRPY